ncbi:motile sperm domain-containing protein 2 isoform X1 [Gadus morhua]|uniref:Motile sperm domain-containing protein 2-like n=3 Tax=Gadus morhua TaxID=8049 RepID=A0A8C5C1G9_GADMO|nr:motile sperm domain-containing protein 2-like isoform X1 [Gadus morhua]XP_030209605.1 motile sperm domain-containing protein 2-like isoform X1 [Gadus morhua]XP_030209606.1 motile sperm domain-containing protein 2-like isoform X1 [Gadus morhua]
MAFELDPSETPESMLNKIEETRERIRSEYDPECSGRYQPVDVQRLWEDDGFVASYLEAKRHVVADTVKMIDESLQWRNEFSVNDIAEDNLQKSFLEAGMHYFRGYDKDGNKLFWFRLKLQAKDSRTLQEKKRYLAFWLERFVRHEPGALLTTVFDMSESGLGNVDMEFLRFLITCFQVYYPRLLAKILIFELPWIMNAAWKIVKSWLGPDAIDKLKFVTRHDVQTYIELEQLPLHMGGMDVFEYSYPPLPDDDFQPPLSESGQGEAGDAGVKETADPEPRLRKEGDVDSRARPPRRPTTTTITGSLLRFSPGRELCFGQSMGDRRCVILLENIPKNPVAYKVRTTAPDNYRVKPSSGVLDPGSSVEIMVSLHGGSQASPQDRFLVMAAEMEKAVAGENQDLAQFWKDIPKTKVMEHRLQCKVLQGVKPAYIQTTNPHADLTNGTGGQQDTHTMMLKLLAGSRRLEQKLDHCLWTENVLIVMVTLLTAILSCCLYTQHTGLGLF